MSHTILIVEDDLRLRASLVQAIRGAPDLKLVGEADDLPEGLRLVDEKQPDVLLVDIGLPSGSGLELIRHAAKQTPHCNVMVITVFAEEQLVLDCIDTNWVSSAGKYVTRFEEMVAAATGARHAVAIVFQVGNELHARRFNDGGRVRQFDGELEQPAGHLARGDEAKQADQR